jgi:hypothetical protein
MSLMFTPETGVPTAPTHQQPMDGNVAGLSRNRAEGVTSVPLRARLRRHR